MMSIIGTKNTAFISNNRKFCITRKFSIPELRYVAEYPELLDNEKLLWLMIAQRAAELPNMVLQISDQKLGALIGEQASTISNILKRIEKQGLLEINYRNFLQPRYKLSLPKSAAEELNSYDKPMLPQRTPNAKKWLNRFNLLMKDVCQMKILKKNQHKSHENSYLGNVNLVNKILRTNE